MSPLYKTHVLNKSDLRDSEIRLSPKCLPQKNNLLKQHTRNSIGKKKMPFKLVFLYIMCANKCNVLKALFPVTISRSLATDRFEKRA